MQENEQAAERAGDKKSTLSRALKGLPERTYASEKKYPSGSPPAGPSPPSPSLQLMLAKGVPKQAGPGQLQADSRAEQREGVSEA